MAGLVPAIPTEKALCLIVRDHRDKPGDDNRCAQRPFGSSQKQIGRWGCRQLNIHNARLLPKRDLIRKDSRLSGSRRSLSPYETQASEMLLYFIAFSSREPVLTSLENAS
jgi:hypothetical protein